MARYVVHYEVFNDVVPNKEDAAVNKITQLNKTFGHHKLEKAIEEFHILLSKEKNRWERFNYLNNDEYNSARVKVIAEDINKVFSHYFEITGLGYPANRNPLCFSRIWIEDTEKTNPVKKTKEKPRRHFRDAEEYFEDEDCYM